MKQKLIRKVYDTVFKMKTVELGNERSNIAELAQELGIGARHLKKSHWHFVVVQQLLMFIPIKLRERYIIFREFSDFTRKSKSFFLKIVSEK
ncbi:hypothetical protein AD998_21605 [bacterium 336/3]|nr:hypothetical protein AD998_21605 [bacterium 336/3]